MQNSDHIAILSAWPIGTVRSIAAPLAGTLNHTLLVEAAAGSFALRGYRHTDRQPVEREHALIAYAQARGVPAVGPLIERWQACRIAPRPMQR